MGLWNFVKRVFSLAAATLWRLAVRWWKEKPRTRTALPPSSDGGFRVSRKYTPEPPPSRNRPPPGYGSPRQQHRGQSWNFEEATAPEYDEKSGGHSYTSENHGPGPYTRNGFPYGSEPVYRPNLLTLYEDNDKLAYRRKRYPI